MPSACSPQFGAPLPERSNFFTHFAAEDKLIASENWPMG
jgi:hypothetical protein